MEVPYVVVKLLTASFCSVVACWFNLFYPVLHVWGIVCFTKQNHIKQSKIYKERGYRDEYAKT